MHHSFSSNVTSRNVTVPGVGLVNKPNSDPAYTSIPHDLKLPPAPIDPSSEHSILVITSANLVPSQQVVLHFICASLGPMKIELPNECRSKLTSKWGQMYHVLKLQIITF